MRRTCRYLPVLALLIGSAPIAFGQAGVDFNLGFGSARDGANSSIGIDNINSPTNPLGACTPGSGDTYCQSAQALSGFFMGIGGDIMFKQKFGAGFDASFQPARQNYGPLLYRETFLDIDGLYQPISTKRASVRLGGGIGFARTGFAINESECVGTVTCSTETTPVGTTNHFQVHFTAGVQIYVTEHIFIRPEFDLHYVPNLTQQFNSNVVPEGLVWIGYNFGHNQ